MTIVKTNKGKGYFNNYILQRIANNKNFLACITGNVGSGKSYSGLHEGEVLDPDFSVDNVVFTARQFLDLVNGTTKQLRKGSFILFDEIQVQLGHLDYQNLQAKLLNYVLQTFRHRNFVLFMTSPNFNYINKSARFLFHCRMETRGIDIKKRQVKLRPLLLQVNQKKSDIYEKYLRVWTKETGVFPLKQLCVNKPSPSLIKAYEEKKSQFTTELNERISRDLSKIEGNKPKVFTEKQKEIVKMLQEGMVIPEIAKRMNKEQNTIYKHLELIKRKGVKITPVFEDKRVISYDILGFDGF